MNGERFDFDSLVGGWRAAFESANDALRAGSHDLTAVEVSARARRLAEERAATIGLLESLARDRREKPLFVRLVASTWDAKRLLGLPRDVAACVFNADGVLVGSAAIHAQAWKETFDAFLGGRLDPTGEALVPFSVEADYHTHIHGKSRVDAIREFLASRGLSLPDGSPEDSPKAETVNGLASRKQRALLRRLDEQGVRAFEGSRLYLELAHDAKVPCAVVSGSTNTHTMLEAAHLGTLVDELVDGNIQRTERLRRKPAPDMLLAACRHLHVAPEHTAVFETTQEGVIAGRAGGFELVVAVDQAGDAEALRKQGADLVVADLGEIIEHELAA